MLYLWSAAAHFSGPFCDFAKCASQNCLTSGVHSKPRLVLGALPNIILISSATLRIERGVSNVQSEIRCLQTRLPYFNLIRRALGKLVDGEHFFDIVTDDTIYEVLYDIGWPRVIRGRTGLMAAFRGYVDNIALQSANNLVVHKTDDGRVVVLEYEVRGTVLATKVKYNNRFCSIIKIENRQIAHWRDYMDSLAAWKALTA